MKSVAQEKSIIRKKMKLMIKSQTEKERRKRSSLIQKKLFSQKEFLSSKHVMMYVSRGTGEVETGPIIEKALKMKKTVSLPVISLRGKRIKPVSLKNSRCCLKKGPFGIYQPEQSDSCSPIRIKDIDLVLLPGLAFDRKNNRLGHGEGYYDRFLKRISGNTPAIGLGFRFQMLGKVPTAQHDIPLKKVITD